MSGRKTSFIIVIIAFLLFPWAVPAKSHKHLPYPLRPVWTSCVRLIRVDYGFEIVEKDKETGYILFDFMDSGMKSPASFEVFEQENDGVPGVKILLTMARLPSYMERLLLDKLERKIRTDYGPPPEIRITPPVEEKQEEKEESGENDGNADSEKDKNDDESDNASEDG